MTQRRITGFVATDRNPGCPFDPSAELVGMRERDGLPRVPVTQPAIGDYDAVTVTRYEDVREAFSDDRLTTGGIDPDAPRMLFNQPGFLLNYNGAEHLRLRRMLTGAFTIKRVRGLRPAIERMVSEHLDAMERLGEVVDLVEAFALPIPSLVICELLGVPYADRREFQERSHTLLDLTISQERMVSTFAGLNEFMAGLITAQRAKPDDSLLGALVREHGQELTDDELLGIGNILLIAGHETTSTMIGLSTLALLENPVQLAAVRDDETVTNSAVEELLRYLSIAAPAVRRAEVDLTIGGSEVKAGERVLLSLQAANRDPGLLAEDADKLDVTRKAVAHMAFGHGVHQCLGQQLARTELRIALPALLRRFPTLRLAVPVEEIEFRLDAPVYGVRALPLTW